MNVIIVTYLPLLGVCATETGMSFDRKWPDRKWPERKWPDRKWPDREWPDRKWPYRKWPDRKWPASALYLTLHPII